MVAGNEANLKTKLDGDAIGVRTRCADMLRVVLSSFRRIRRSTRV